MRKLESTDSRIQKAIVLYKSGKTIKPICKELHLDGTTFRRILIQENLLRSRSEAIRNGKTDGRIKDDVFDVLTSEALYWIGFLYTDGHIENNRNRISLTLSEKDRGHLEKLNHFISDGKLTIRDVTQDSKKTLASGQKNVSGRFFRLAFSSEQISKRLKELGFTHLKTLNIVPHELLKYSRDFWRGCIDGDGWVCMNGDTRANGKYNYPVIGLSGTETTLIEYLKFIKLSNIQTETKPKKDKRANVWSVDLHNNPAKKVLDLLYKNATVYLDRKYHKYLEIIKKEN